MISVWIASTAFVFGLGAFGQDEGVKPAASPATKELNGLASQIAAVASYTFTSRTETPARSSMRSTPTYPRQPEASRASTSRVSQAIAIAARSIG